MPLAAAPSRHRPALSQGSDLYLKADGTPVTEQVEGYSAIIFQHECDHLDGILYTDRADTVYVNEAWAAEREQFSYQKPDWWQ